jgi:hypothetical protein
MLTENDIISLLADYLRSKEYEITQSLQTTRQGIDLIAEHKTHTLYVEAKGATSSKEHSKRYGNSFNSSQIKSHVSRAVLTCMEVLDCKPSGLKTKVGIALPNTPGHRDLIRRVSKSLKTLGIKLFWVSAKSVDGE